VWLLTGTPCTGFMSVGYGIGWMVLTFKDRVNQINYTHSSLIDAKDGSRPSGRQTGERRVADNPGRKCRGSLKLPRVLSTAAERAFALFQKRQRSGI
jgi:hypothetical protein